MPELPRIALYVPHFEDQPAGLGTFVEAVGSRLAVRHPDLLLITEDPERRPEWASRLECISCLSPFGRVAKRRAVRRIDRLVWINTSLQGVLTRRSVGVLLSPAQEGPLRTGSVRHVLIVHDLTPVAFPSSYAPSHVLMTRTYTRALASRADHVVAVSQNTRKELAALWGISNSSMSVSLEGYDVRWFYPPGDDAISSAMERYGLPSEYLLYSGTFAAHKGLDVLLDSLAELRDAGEPILLAVTGGARASRSFDFAAEVLARGLESHVRVLGYVPREDLAPLMANATAFVFPSLHEGFGLAPLEAMACGAVVLASSAASLPEVVGTGGVLLPANNIDAWVSAIRSVRARDLPGAATRTRLRNAALIQAQKFDWEAVVNHVNRTLKGEEASVVEGAGRHGSNSA